MPVGRTLISGSPYLGVYVRASDRVAVAPTFLPAAAARELERLLGTPILRTTVAASEIVGSLVAFNGNGVLVGDGVDDDEAQVLEQVAPVHRLTTRHNALGNNVLANDTGAIVHPEFGDDAVDRIGRALQVRARRGTVAGLGTVGMAGVATNRGVVVHPKATPKETDLIQEVLEVPVHRSTANFGVPVVGACLIANSRAFIVGRPTTPVEIVHLQEGLGIYD